MKPCPLCGKAIAFEYDGDYYAVAEFYFHCDAGQDGCGLILPASGRIAWIGDVKHVIPDPQDLERWNRRSPA